MAGDVVYTGKFKEDLDQMRLGKMEKRARYKAASSIGLSYMRPPEAVRQRRPRCWAAD